MSEWNADGDASHSAEPPRRPSLRRAVLTGVAGLTLVAGPVGISMAMTPGDHSTDVEAGDRTGRLSAVLGERATLATELSAERVNAALAAQEVQGAEKQEAVTTTTTTAPPTTTTTAPSTTQAPTPATEPATTEAPAPQPTAGGGGLGDPYYIPSWDQLAQCESGGNWSINSGNGYYGGLQFSLSSWQSVGGSGYPHQASREEQISRGQALWERQGWGAWPACTSSFGWR